MAGNPEYSANKKDIRKLNLTFNLEMLPGRPPAGYLEKSR